MMEYEAGWEPIVAVDCGSATTRAALFAVIEDAYRFVARGQAITMADGPDLMPGVRRALEQVESSIGRRYLIERGSNPARVGEQIEGAGSLQELPRLVVTTSAAPPLRVVVVGLVEDFTLETARRAATTAYVTIVDALSSTDGSAMEQQVEKILRQRPDVILIAGGTEGGAQRGTLHLVQTVALACSALEEASRPHLVYAGNSLLHQEVRQLLDGQVEVSFVENVCPALDQERLNPVRAELDRLYERRSIQQLLGTEKFAQSGEIHPSAQAFAWVTQAVGALQARARPALGIDVGSRSVTVAASFDSGPVLEVDANLGVGGQARAVLDQAGEANIARWLPFPLQSGELTDFVWNKVLRPNTIPQQPRDLLIEQALAREAARLALSRARAKWPEGETLGRLGSPLHFRNLIAAGAALAQAPRPGQTALAMLDAVQPTGISALLVDSWGIAIGLGAAGLAHPVAALQALQYSALTPFGTLVCPVTAISARRGGIALRLKLRYGSGGPLRGVLEAEVALGSLEALPLPPGQTATLELQPAPEIDLGLAGPGVGGAVEVIGGVAGVVIDARGRPLKLPEDATERQMLVQQWLWAVGA